MAEKTGWEREYREHFDAIVDTYDKIRPSYPSAIFTDIAEYCGANAGKTALEIGAGTGKATADMLDAGYDVMAVELGADMSAFLRERFGERDDFRVITSAFEDAQLPTNAFDLVYAASAFHWIDAEVGCPKVLRILRDGGTLAMFRYNAPPADGDALYEEMQEAYKRFFHQPYKRPQRITETEYSSPAGIHKGFRCEPLENYGFRDVTMKFYYNSRTFTTDEYIMMLDTFSDHIVLPDDDRAALYAGVRSAIERHGGRITVDYAFQLYMARK